MFTWATLSTVHAISPSPIVACGRKDTNKIENWKLRIENSLIF